MRVVCEEETDGLYLGVLSALSQHRRHQGGQARQRYTTLSVSKRAMHAADPSVLSHILAEVE